MIANNAKMRDGKERRREVVEMWHEHRGLDTWVEELKSKCRLDEGSPNTIKGT